MTKHCEGTSGTESKPDLRRVQQAIDLLAEQGLIVQENGGWKITPAGRRCFELGSTSRYRSSRRGNRPLESS